MKLWKYAQTRSQEDMTLHLKDASRKVYRAIRKAKRGFEKKIAGSDDKRLLYGYIKSKAQNRVSVGPLKSKEGKEVKDFEEMADLLAEHYSSVFRTEALPMEEVRQLFTGDARFWTRSLQKLLSSSSSPGFERRWQQAQTAFMPEYSDEHAST